MTRLIPSALVALLAAGTVALHPGRDPDGRMDRDLFVAINGHRWPWPAEIALRLISHFGLLPINVALWGAAIVWLDRESGAVGGMGMLVAWATCRVVKSATNRVRPHLAIEGSRLVGLTPSGSSFPSSHAALATYSAITGAVILGLGAPGQALFLAVAAVVGYVRVYLGAHYPRDVVVGALIGAAAGTVTTLVLTGLP